MTGIPAARSQFFGRDNFTPFIGRVEDVNDPKHSGRVKIRCIGWHPQSKQGGERGNEDGLSTDDLPWARVGMPVTHAQQARIGGKHGLLPGCWCFGFFLDGDEAQDPMVLSTINFTNNASGENDRRPLKGRDGTDMPEDGAFNKSLISDKTQPNAALRVKGEDQRKFGGEYDVSGDGWNADHDGVKCGGKKPLRSKAAYERQEEPNTKETPTGQNTDVLQGDGRCGTTQHARDDIQMLLKQYFPAANSRFNYRDAVWNNYTGDYLNLNGILAQLAIAICSELKTPINAEKSVANRENRTEKAAKIKSKKDRDGVDRDKLEDKRSLKGDAFNAKMQTSLIDKLCDIMMKMLQAMDGQGETEDSDNTGGTITVPTSPIENPGAICITDTILRNIEILVSVSINFNLILSDDEAEEFDPDDNKNPFFSQSMTILGALAGVMQFPLMDMSATRTDVHNKKGDKSQDKENKKIGCRDDRVYNTELGSLKSIAGFSFGKGEFGAGRGSSIRDYLPDVGFGGKDRYDESESTNLLCDDAYTKPVKDDGTGEEGGGIPTPDYDDVVIGCNDTKQCPRGFICIDGKCRSTTNPWPDDTFEPGTLFCGEDKVFEGINVEGAQCPPGFICLNGVCVNEDDVRDCTSERPCPDGEICVDGFCVSDGNLWDRSQFDGIGDNSGRGNEFFEPESFQGIGTYLGDLSNDIFEPGPFQGIGVYRGDLSNTFLEPNGKGGKIIAVSIPSSEPRAAKNFRNGTPNTLVVIRPGELYHFKNPLDDTRVYPSVYVQGYQAQPIPVVDRRSGELVAVLSAAAAYDPNNPVAPVSIHPDDSVKGIITDDPQYDITLGGFHIANTGFDYTNPTIEIIDKDKRTSKNAEAKLVVDKGRIVSYEIINNGTQFRRIPEIVITDETGFGATLYPIMNVVPNEDKKPLPEPVQMIFCPDNQRNYY